MEHFKNLWESMSNVQVTTWWVKRSFNHCRRTSFTNSHRLGQKLYSLLPIPLIWIHINTRNVSRTLSTSFFLFMKSSHATVLSKFPLNCLDKEPKHTWSCRQHNGVLWIHHPINPQCKTMAYPWLSKFNLQEMCFNKQLSKTMLMLWKVIQ